MSKDNRYQRDDWDNEDEFNYGDKKAQRKTGNNRNKQARDLQRKEKHRRTHQHV